MWKKGWKVVKVKTKGDEFKLSSCYAAFIGGDAMEVRYQPGTIAYRPAGGGPLTCFDTFEAAVKFMSDNERPYDWLIWPCQYVETTKFFESALRTEHFKNWGWPNDTKFCSAIRLHEMA